MTARKRSASQRWLPSGYAILAIAIAALLLPSVLRPPQDLQSTSTAFSPDAPPDDSPPEALLQSLRRASSSTAGGTTVEVQEIVEEVQEAVPPRRRRAARGHCFGDPPRQEESLYATLCAPAWTGTDNGGATTKGVDGETIRIAIPVNASSESREGPLSREFEDIDTELEHSLKVYQYYFNDRYVFYGRYMQLCLFKRNENTEDNQRAGIAQAIARCDPFAIINGDTNSAAVVETIRNKIIDMGSISNPHEFYRDRNPYTYSFTMDTGKSLALWDEMICKQWGTRPLSYQNLNEREDLTFNYNAPRKYGLIAYQDNTRTDARALIESQLATCGIKIEAYGQYNLEDNAQAIGAQAAKMKQAQITTVLCGCDILSAGLISFEADNLQYYPEWIHPGSGYQSDSYELYKQTQARHFVGLSFSEISRPDEDKDWFRAYKEIDPDGEPDNGRYYRNLQQLAAGIQYAGGLRVSQQEHTKLTPQTFWEGLKSIPERRPNPIWSIGGGYGADDFTYMDFVSLIWWSEEEQAHCHLDAGKRYKVGEIPSHPLAWQQEPPAGGCITKAPSGIQG